ncbi:inorganic phosphate transporter [Natranaeroarchaeum aerophilus]|uniref:Phosphate transporter n=1 Tax=Natranaeroarchaeum aerophilus TaxID=2917711 RepID=A0AAE3FNN2_9EURY|nr:inorganic phosphate transporter [Natranaeroarchaeum aerophilus]MCL9812265.1 inorganic phosphate transporter family protein [Natranaeroarchaeum aerophilus]
MVETILLIGVVASIFVGFNIGGSSTGIAWGPPVGAGVVSKATAAVLMTFFVFLGGWTVGRNVLGTLSEGIITLEGGIPLAAGVAILFFIGLGILVANVFGVPVPTSMTTVGAIAGLGLATNTLNYALIAEIISWWFVTPIIGFWIGGVIGRYLYPAINQRVDIEKSAGPLLVFDRRGSVPKPTLGPNTTRSEVVSTAVVFVIACYMAFSAGASNVPNAAAPLVGTAGGLTDDTAIIIATLAIGIGAFTIARRTMESVGGELSDIPLLAALFVMLTASTITTVLSWLGIPISLVMATVMTIVGIGWGRATRPITVSDAVRRDVGDQEIAPGAITADQPRNKSAPIGEAEPDEVLNAGDLFNPRAIIKYISMWIIGPSMSTGLAYGFFVLFPGVV